MTSNDIYIPEFSDSKRLEIFKFLSSACSHLYSKGKLNEELFAQLTPVFAELAMEDPVFLAHLTAYANKRDNKDLKVLSTFFNSISDANGQPFFPGATRNKPNLREVSAAVLQGMDPKLALRVLELGKRRFGVEGLLNESTHWPTSMKKAFMKYLFYREQNPEMLRGIRRSGLSKKISKIYKLSHVTPSDEASSILGWTKHRDGRVVEKETLPDFKEMKTREIVTWFEENKLSPIVALSVIPPEKITVSVAKALLNNCTGNQSIVLMNWFNKNGFFEIASIKALFKDKVATAGTAVDRIDTLSRDADEEDKKMLSGLRSERRKEQAGLDSIMDKMWLHIDTSHSMSSAIDFAQEKGTIFAECVSNPTESFRWGTFATSGHVLPLPENFTKEDFFEVIYNSGVRAGGCTDTLALYPQARQFGADVDVYLTDGGHYVPSGSITAEGMANLIKNYHECHPEHPMPKCVVIVWFQNGQHSTRLEDAFRLLGIPVSVLKPEALSESALVAEAVKTAVVGELALIDEIMDTPLPNLPRWYHSINRPRVNKKSDLPVGV